MRNRHRKFGKRIKGKQVAKYQLIFDEGTDAKSVNEYIRYFNRIINSSISVAVPNYVKIEKL